MIAGSDRKLDFAAWHQGWTKDVRVLDQRVREAYRKGGKDIIAQTWAAVAEARGWGGYQNGPEAIARMGCWFLPYMENFPYGPFVLFPSYGLGGELLGARLHPMFRLTQHDHPVRYTSIGISGKDIGMPLWLGGDRETLAAIVKTHTVLLVEGPYDLTAVRLAVSPDEVPSLSSGTKTITDEHMEHLRILGVRRLMTMFDQDQPRPGRTAGAGEIAAKWLHRSSAWATANRRLVCPAHDPSDAVKEGKLTEMAETIRTAAKEEGMSWEL